MVAGRQAGKKEGRQERRKEGSKDGRVPPCSRVVVHEQLLRRDSEAIPVAYPSKKSQFQQGQVQYEKSVPVRPGSAR